MDYARLATELTVDPLARGYVGMTATQVVASMNTIDREGTGDALRVRSYFLLEKNRTNSGTDTKPLFIYGRLRILAAASDGADVFGSGTPATLEAITSAATLLRLVDDADFILAFSDARFDELLDDCRQAGVLSAGDKNAVIALSANRLSRAQELGFGVLREGHVEKARAL